MVLSIKDPQADRLARELAKLTGETITGVVVSALQEKLQRETRLDGKNFNLLLEEIHAISSHFTSLPILDQRSEDEILGYDEFGIPTQ